MPVGGRDVAPRPVCATDFRASIFPLLFFRRIIDK
jgi:hypothetical protein